MTKEVPRGTTTHSQPPLEANTILAGRYRVDRMVASGGFGTVYAGRHLVLSAPIAIKVLRTDRFREAGGTDHELGNFLEEARMLARLRHPNVVSVLDAGVESEASLPWMVLEWCEGPTLKEALTASAAPMAPRAAWQLVRPIAEGIAYAHENGIAHRDLKPSNVILTRQGNATVPRVLDFGVAKSDARAWLEGDTRTQDPGAYTAAYAAPEQVTRGRTGPWTDVHGLALLFLEVLTGKAPYAADYPLEAAVSAERPTPRALGAEVSETLERAIARALSLKPAARHPNARVFIAEMDEALGEPQDRAAVASARSPMERAARRSEPVVANAPTEPHTGMQMARSAPPLLPKPRSRRTWGIAALAGVVALAVAGAITSTRPARQGAPRQVEASAPRPLTNTDSPSLTYSERLLVPSRAGAVITASAISNDGEQIAYVEGRDLWVLAARSGERRRLEHPREFHPTSPNFLAFLPDGETLALGGVFEGRGELWMLGVAGGGSRRARAFSEDDGGPPQLSPDGKRVAYGCALGLMVGAVDGEMTEHPIATTHVDEGIQAVSWSPSGEEIAFVRSRLRGSRTAWLEVTSFDGKHSHRVIEDPRLASRDGTAASAWLYPNAIFVSRDAPLDAPRRGEVVKVALDDAGEAVGALEVVAAYDGETVSKIGGGGGRLLIGLDRAKGEAYAGRLTANGARLEGELAQLSSDGDDAMPFGWLPDGRVLVRLGREGRDLFAQAAGGVAVLVARGVVGRPTVSPRGEVLFARAPAPLNSPCRIMRASLVGTSFEETLVTELPRATSSSCDLSVYCPRASPTRCVLRRAEPMGTHLSWFDLTSGRVLAAIANETHAVDRWALSPDGALLAASSDSLTLVASAGGAKRELNITPEGLVQDIAFTRDSRALLLTGMVFPDAPYALARTDLDGHVQILLRSDTDWFSHPEIGADGRTFAIHKRAFSSELRLLEPR
jgi:serine/threonine protein kinase